MLMKTQRQIESMDLDTLANMEEELLKLATVEVYDQRVEITLDIVQEEITTRL